MFPVIVNLDNISGLLRPGMNAEVTVLVDQALDVVLVPNTAIVQTSDVGPAAMALGLDIESIDLAQFMRSGRGGFAGMGGGERPAGAEHAVAAGAQRTGASPQEAGGDRMAQFDSLRARVDRGEVSQDSLRAVMQAMRQRGGQPGADAPTDGAAPAVATRGAVVFVVNDAGVPEPRLIQVGLNDWDNTQAVSGLEEGAVLAVVGAAQLQAQQAQFLANMRSRMGGGRGPR